MPANFLSSFLISINVKIAIYTLCYLSLCMVVKLHLWYCQSSIQTDVLKTGCSEGKLALTSRAREMAWENCITRSSIFCIFHKILLGQSHEGECEGLGKWNMGGRQRKCIKIVSKTWKKRPFWRCRNRWENTTELNLKGTVWVWAQAI